VSTEADKDGSSARSKVLLQLHPRASWHAARSASAAFWLEVHEHLRRDAAGLLAAGEDYRGSPQRLAVVAAPRLNGLIAAMHGHHQIEDFHYFPAFRRTEPQLAAGFDRLERDHAGLGLRIEAALAALGELRAAVTQPAQASELSTAQLAANHYAEAAASLCGELTRHLDDEENLVVPLLLESGAY
jgi:hypothetical protein